MRNTQTLYNKQTNKRTPVYLSTCRDSLSGTTSCTLYLPK